jgi:hypothetical protein
MMIPDRLVCGDSASIPLPLDRWPAADGWRLVVRLSGMAGGRSFDLVPDGDGWVWRVTVDDTAGMVPGTYDVGIWGERPGERVTVHRGRLRLLPDPATAAGGGAGFWERLKEACEASLLRKASSDQQSMEFAGRKLSRYGVTELTALLRECERQIAQAERLRRGQRGGRRVLARFGGY